MTPDRLFVTVLGFALIVFIVWFFWLKKSKGTRASMTSSGHHEETASCSEMVLLPDFEKSAQLPTGETTAVEFVPTEPGEYEFACQMGMFRGRLIVE